MVPPKKTPTNRGKHPAVMVPDNKTYKHEDDALDPKTPTPNPLRLVNTDKDNEDDNGADKVETNIERDKVITYRDHIIRERGDLAFRLNSNVTSSGALVIEAVATRKSIKMPNALMLSDSKEVRFET
ncbi:hypothetical protein N7447_010969 [Penicillium robsamsonii]|uniref:uncharacterized protein n=1 Tax=Penicillium robsamsonii TaxID=1792511 RepID=UPI0025491EFB|nr:uncharacterized protein N7447_010969 [Penicillium robsamsonii]KAJ5807513.1 hypothetical protein N7447_010969 [Penicillium robsamsonii]